MLKRRFEDRLWLGGIKLTSVVSWVFAFLFLQNLFPVWQFFFVALQSDLIWIRQLRSEGTSKLLLNGVETNDSGISRFVFSKSTSAAQPEADEWNWFWKVLFFGFRDWFIIDSIIESQVYGIADSNIAVTRQHNYVIDSSTFQSKFIFINMDLIKHVEWCRMSFDMQIYR